MINTLNELEIRLCFGGMNDGGEISTEIQSILGIILDPIEVVAREITTAVAAGAGAVVGGIAGFLVAGPIGAVVGVAGGGVGIFKYMRS